jgi:hypothetical protein
MNFDELSNPWSEYLLSDGRKMRIRHVLVDVVQSGIDPNGLPIYNVNIAPPIVWIEPAPQDNPLLGLNEQKGSLQ